MPYIRQIRTTALRGIPPLEIELLPAEGKAFRHLVLTGPNGSGKTSILGAIAAAVCTALYGHDNSRIIALEVTTPTLDKPFPEDRSRDLVSKHATLEWTTSVEEVLQRFERREMVSAYLPARRGIAIAKVEAISPESYAKWNPLQPATPQLLQFLVNRKAQQSFARDDHDDASAEQLEAWFQRLERGIGQMLGEDDLRLEFDRKRLTFLLACGGRRYDLLQLAHGHAAALGVLAEVLMRVELSREDVDHTHDSGVVLIDEPEMHLHLELQERILPALVELFPGVQFIVATHSPVIVSSIGDAIVLDLEDRTPRRSEDLRGHPYGWIMKRHFGLEEDFDLATTERLHELDQLQRLDAPTDEQRARLEQLAEELSATSHVLALEVWSRVLASRLARAERESAE